MLVLNGNKFAKTEEEFTNSLFETGGTCVGYYKPLKTQVKLYNHNHEFVGTITKNRVMAKATRLENGKYWYSYGDIPQVGRYVKYSDQYNDILKAVALFTN